ncbi:MAG: HEAT repeat domain-containing protein [Thermodesulfobacteriota bacterium]
MDEERGSVVDLIRTLLKAIKAFKLYQSNNPMLTKQLEELTTKFTAHLDHYQTLNLQVGEYKLLFNENPVYENTDMKESLAFLLYKDGVREIRFFEGLGEQEICDFLDVLRRNEQASRLEDDIVTLLWERDFAHISYFATDEFMESNAVQIPENYDEFQAGLEFSPDTEGETASTSTQESEEVEMVLASGEMLPESVADQRETFATHFRPTAEEAEAIDRLINQEADISFVSTLVDSLMEILLHLGEDLEPYENMVTFFDRALEFLVLKGEFKTAGKILKNLREILDSMALKDNQIFAINRIFEGAGSPQVIELTAKTLKHEGFFDLNTSYEYFDLLPKSAIEPLCNMLGQLESPKAGKLIAEIIGRKVKGDLEVLIPFLNDKRWIVVCYVINIIGSSRDRNAIKYLSQAINHPDERVRRTVLKALSQYGGKEIKAPLMKMLNDESSYIRSQAVIHLARSSKHEALKAILSIIQSEPFLTKDFSEKAAFFRAIGEIRSDESLPVLRKIVEKRTWFRKPEWNQLQLCAIGALRMIGSEQSRKILETGKRSKNQAVRRACLKALNESVA